MKDGSSEHSCNTLASADFHTSIQMWAYIHCSLYHRIFKTFLEREENNQISSLKRKFHFFLQRNSYDRRLFFDVLHLHDNAVSANWELFRHNIKALIEHRWGASTSKSFALRRLPDAWSPFVCQSSFVPCKLKRRLESLRSVLGD